MGVCQVNGGTGFCLLASTCGEAAVEGDVEGVQGGLPPVGPPLAALPGRVQAHQCEVEALQGGLFGRYVESETASSSRLIFSGFFAER